MTSFDQASRDMPHCSHARAWVGARCRAARHAAASAGCEVTTPTGASGLRRALACAGVGAAGVGSEACSPDAGTAASEQRRVSRAGQLTGGAAAAVGGAVNAAANAAAAQLGVDAADVVVAECVVAVAERPIQ